MNDASCLHLMRPTRLLRRMRCFFPDARVAKPGSHVFAQAHAFYYLSFAHVDDSPLSFHIIRPSPDENRFCRSTERDIDDINARKQTREEAAAFDAGASPITRRRHARRMMDGWRSDDYAALERASGRAPRLLTRGRLARM